MRLKRRVFGNKQKQKKKFKSSSVNRHACLLARIDLCSVVNITHIVLLSVLLEPCTISVTFSPFPNSSLVPLRPYK